MPKGGGGSVLAGIGSPIAGGSDPAVLFIGPGGFLEQDPGHFDYDSSVKTLTITGSTNPQLRLLNGDGGGFEIRTVDTGGGLSQHITMQALPGGTGAYAQWTMYGSDFLVTMEGNAFEGLGVPLFCVAGPPGTSGAPYTSDSGPGYGLMNLLETTDNKVWSMFLNAKSWELDLVNDNTSAGTTAIRVTRNGLVPDTIAMISNNFIISNASDLGKTTDLYTDTSGDFHILPLAGDKGIQIGGSGTKLSFFTVATPIVQQASGADLTNNVTGGGTNDTIADFSNLITYATDAATIRNDIYQLARKLKQVNDALRAYGLLT